MRFLILSHLEDLTAMRVFAALKSRYGTEQVSLVTSEELMFAPHWSHRLGDFPTQTEIHLFNGLRLVSGEIGVVFNRIKYVYFPQSDNAAQDDRDYAVVEVYALWLSWLASLTCRVINPACTRGLGANEHSQLEWFYLASQSGLPVQGYFFSSNPRRYNRPSYRTYKRADPIYWKDGPILQEIPSHTVGSSPAFYLEPLGGEISNVLIAGDQILGALADEFYEKLKVLSRLSGCDLLQVTFAPSRSIDVESDLQSNQDRHWRVCRVNAFPQVEDDASIFVIAAMLENASVIV